jgi:competence protein ComEA
VKEWLAEHKFYLVAGTILALGSLYYLFIYQPGISEKQEIAGTETLSAKTQTAPEMKQNEPTKQPEKEEKVVVDVKGEIKQPGVYQSNQSERVMDVIEKAGGLTDNADQSQVNFAAHVQDEMII